MHILNTCVITESIAWPPDEHLKGHFSVVHTRKAVATNRTSWREKFGSAGETSMLVSPSMTSGPVPVPLHKQRTPHQDKGLKRAQVGSNKAELEQAVSKLSNDAQATPTLFNF